MENMIMKIIESYEVKDKFMKTPIGDVENVYRRLRLNYSLPQPDLQTIDQIAKLLDVKRSDLIVD